MKHESTRDRVVRDHLTVSAHGRRLLEYVGQYPLLTAGELARVLGATLSHVSTGLGDLARQELITTLAGYAASSNAHGYVLTARGIALLAAQAGHAPAEYAALRRWPMRWGADGPHYSVEGLVTAREHTRLVLEFLFGLRAVSARQPRLRLVHWDHVQCLYEFPEGPSAGQREPRARVTPDARARVRVEQAAGSHWVDTEFWLEIDRGGLGGRRLMRKLARYYEARGSLPDAGTSGWLPRLLVVVERDDEARARALRRRFALLDERFGARLEVFITRLDLLRTRHGYLDPTRKAWRRPEAWGQFTYAFDGLPLTGRGTLARLGDQRGLEAARRSRARRVAAQRARRAREQAERK